MQSEVDHDPFCKWGYYVCEQEGKNMSLDVAIRTKEVILPSALMRPYLQYYIQPGVSG